jgi:ribosomal protein S18 acetylase RimI-like enzyme
VDVRPIDAGNRAELAALVTHLWGGDTVVAHGVVFHPADLPGFLAVEGEAVVGVLTCTQVDADTIEIVTIDALDRARGIGTALLAAMATAATEQGARRLVLTTTNDNVDALRFYQRRGFHLTALRRGALTRSRELKPTIPLVGEHGIPLTDELELTRDL